MQIVVAAQNQLLLSLSNDELAALANCANELLHNSTVDEHDCATRLGLGYEKLKRLHRDLIAALDSKKAPAAEVFEVGREGDSIQIRAISASGDPVALSFDEVRDKIQPILDEEE